MIRAAGAAVVTVAIASAVLALAPRGEPARDRGTPSAAVATALPARGTASGDAGDRIAADRRAKDAFLRLHFFADGRGMHQVPELIRAYDLVAPLLNRPLLERRWGFVVEKGRPVGLLRTEWRGITMGVAGCAMCHSGRVAGRFVPGLGNKNIDVTQTARDVRILERMFMPLPLDPSKNRDWQALRRQSIGFSDRLADVRHGNFTQGLVPLAFIRQWFYGEIGREMPVDPGHASVKVPALWGYAEKRPEGSFCDGMGEGVGWAAAVELASGQQAATVRGYTHRLEDAERHLAAFLPPAYPYAVDGARARRGAHLFEKHCAGCHGGYDVDAAGLPVYRAPRFIALHKVQTDSARLAANTADFYAVAARNPLRDIMGIRRTERGYFAPRLVGVWSRFPYLHNGSVPSLAALLEPPARRPRGFSLAAAGEERRFDREAVGLTVPAPDSREERRLLARGRRGARDVFFTGRPGHGNHGHAFGTRLAPAEKRDLLEYLKTL